MLEKELYGYYQQKIDKERLEYTDVQQISDDYMNKLLQNYMDKKRGEMLQQLSVANRFQKLLFRAVSDNLSYYIGIFSGIIKSFEVLLRTKNRKEYFHNTMIALYGKSRVKDILDYLYRKPDSQHKTIAAELDINKSYLTQLLRELEKEGCVERFATGKRSFYSLSVEGQAYVTKKRQENESIMSLFEGKYEAPNRNQEQWYINPTDRGWYILTGGKFGNISSKEVACVGKR